MCVVEQYQRGGDDGADAPRTVADPPEGDPRQLQCRHCNPTPPEKFAHTAPPSSARVTSSQANEDHAAGDQDCRDDAPATKALVEDQGSDGGADDDARFP